MGRAEQGRGLDFGDLWVMRADGTGKRRLTRSVGDDSAPAWSPNGQRIVFVRQQDRYPYMTDLFTIRADGSGLRRVTRDRGGERVPAWSPDGGRIAYSYAPRYPSCGCDGSEDVFTVRPDGSRAKVLFDLDEQAVALSLDYSPDGSRLAVGILDSGQQATSVVTVGSDGSGPPQTVSPPDGDATTEGVTYSPDGTRIAFNYYYSLRTASPDGEGASVVADTDDRTERNPDWGPATAD